MDYIDGVGRRDSSDESSVGIPPRLSYKRDVTFPICTVAPKCHGGMGRLSTAPAQPLDLCMGAHLLRAIPRIWASARYGEGGRIQCDCDGKTKTDVTDSC